MRRRIITGLIAALTMGAVVLGAAAAEGERPRFWPILKANTPAAVTEWFTDIPWRQKLGTYNGNEIDQALVLPFDVLDQASKDLCTKTLKPALTEEQCMIEIGVSNIVGTHRTDTPYDPADAIAKGGTYCKDSSDSGDTKLPCIEVKLELSFWKAQPTGKVLPEGEPIELMQQPLGNENPPAYDSGFVITDGSTYAPQMPWYMSHYCDSKFAEALDGQDPVCYADYLSPMNSGFNGNGATGWPKGAAFSVFPVAVSPPAPGNHCMGGLKTCTIALAAFDLHPVPQSLGEREQYYPYNKNLIRWFNRALAQFPQDVTEAERQRHFAWTTKSVGWEDFVYQQALFNPFQGTFKFTGKQAPVPNCDVTFDGTVDLGPPVRPGKCPNTGNQFAETFQYPRQCSLDDLGAAAGADLAKVAKLRNCSLNYELHPNGFKGQWPNHGTEFVAAGMEGNQYGRTSFVFAGVPGMQLPASFLKSTDSDLSIYEQVYNASIFSMYLPIANVADFKNGMDGRNYKDTEFYHTLLMSNHNEAEPQRFADGIRGKVLWHNEYRMQGMYNVRQSKPLFRDRTFAAAFDPNTATAPYHNHTCDSCHVRNGSGIPINTKGELDLALQDFMASGVYNPAKVPDYTFTGKITPMKLVFFDLRRKGDQLDASRYSEPLSLPPAVLNQPENGRGDDSYYNNTVMNYYGDSFHVTKSGYSYTWSYVELERTSKRLVVADVRTSPEIIDPKTGRNKIYQPLAIKLDAFQNTAPCNAETNFMPDTTRKPWPKTCKDIEGPAITAAITGGEVGYMHLNGKRLGNLSAMEAIPNEAIKGFRDTQLVTLGTKMAGELIWQAGSRDGIDNVNNVKKCDGPGVKDLTNCYIGRFGWVGDRVSLEDQVANAAFVEMNMTTSAGYKKLYPNNDAKFPIRYAHNNCGPANKLCIEAKSNADLTERDIERMADYGRWLGNPTRSELKVALPEVIAGEKIFRTTGCDTCHVIKKIEIVPDDTMLTADFRQRLETRVKPATGTTPKVAPFLSYIGTDLLMHDMGYLSQVGDTTVNIRDSDGVVMRQYENYMQKIRTPALKGLGLNRFVTDSYKNTKTYTGDPSQFKLDAACDFLLHDGRACDAIEAAFLHDGPAIKKLDVISKLNKLSAEQMSQLRAFLYSL